MIKTSSARLVLLMAVCLLSGANIHVLADDDDERRRGRKSGHYRADDDDGRRSRDSRDYRGGEYKEKYREGRCSIEREWKKNGSYKEERECRSVFDGPYYRRGREYEEKLVDGPCKVEREWKKDGTYKEKQECKARGHAPRHARAPVAVVQPPWIVAERSGPIYRRGWEPSTVVSAPSGDLFRCNRDLVGTAIGGVAGGVIGSQIGQGDGRTVATIGGAIAGALIGGAIGRDMDTRDQACIGHALEFSSAGRKVSWMDRDRDARYAVIPGRIERRTDGRYCRPYDADVVVDGRLQKIRGTACRRPDGTWVKAS